MHDIELHIGDLIVSWAKYGPDERGLLLNLMLHYYKEENGLPNDEEKLAEIADCRTAAHRKALMRLVARHYKADEHGVLRHRKADVKIAEYRHRCHANAHNALSRFVKESGGQFALPDFETFAAHREHFQDPITKRWRNLPPGENSQGNAPPPAKPRGTEICDSQNTALRKVAASGASLPPSHSPSFPPSHSPTLPSSQPGPESEASAGVPEAESSTIFGIEPGAFGAELDAAQKKERAAVLEDPPDLILYLALADDHARGNGEGFSVPPAFVRWWHGLRVSTGWEKASGMPVPNTTEARWQDCLTLARTKHHARELAPFAMSAPGEKKKSAAARLAEKLKAPPGGQWREFARERLGWSLVADDAPWEQSEPSARRELWLAWEADQRRVEAEAGRPGEAP